MDYSKIYNNLISKAKNRKLDCYTESPPYYTSVYWWF